MSKRLGQQNSSDVITIWLSTSIKTCSHHSELPLLYIQILYFCWFGLSAQNSTIWNAMHTRQKLPEFFWRSRIVFCGRHFMFAVDNFFIRSRNVFSGRDFFRCREFFCGTENFVLHALPSQYSFIAWPFASYENFQLISVRKGSPEYLAKNNVSYI